jgi:hypothetical protein
MSSENKEVKPNEKPADAGTKPAAEDKKEDNKESTDKKEDNEADKKKQRLERFGMSTEEDLNKRKERFKDQIKELEEEKEKEKEKAKGERGRIRRNNNYKNNNYRNSRDGGYRRTHRDFRRGGGKFHERRIRGDRRNNSYRK